MERNREYFSGGLAGSCLYQVVRLYNFHASLKHNMLICNGLSALFFRSSIMVRLQREIFVEPDQLIGKLVYELPVFIMLPVLFIDWGANLPKQWVDMPGQEAIQMIGEIMPPLHARNIPNIRLSTLSKDVQECRRYVGKSYGLKHQKLHS